MELMKYIKDNKGRRIGVLVSNQYNSVGWSLCNIRKEKFDKEKGIEIARGREAKGTLTAIPMSIVEQVAEQLERSRRYFK